MLSIALALASFGTPPAATERPWTFLVYGAADNNADGPILEFLDTVREALNDDPGVELVLFVDRSKGYSDDAKSLGEDFADARIYRLRKSVAERIDPGADFPELAGSGEHEVDSGNPEMLGKFVTFAKKRFPAKHTAMMIYSHADGRGMCPDEESRTEMRIPELRDRVGEAASVDFLGLELCNMGGIEAAYEWRPGNGGFSTNVLVAIPNAGPPLDWDRAFARIRSKGHDASPLKPPFLDPVTMTAADFGKLVMEEGRRGRELAMKERPENVEHEAAACYDLRQAKTVKQAIDAMAVALAASDDAKDYFLEMRGPGPIGDALHYDEGGPFIDVFDLCRRAADCDALSDEVRARAEVATEAIDAFVLASFGMSGYAGFESGKNGVFIILPANQPGRWKNLSWYTPLAHDEGGKDYGHWAFLADGATPSNGKVDNWFELLDSWFDAADDAGGVNGYRW